MMAAAEQWRLTLDRLLWLMAALTLVVLPHAPRMPLWVIGAFLVLGLWRLAGALRGTRLPGRFARLLLQMMLVAGVYMEYGTIMGRTAGIALLITLVGMKLLETRDQRDAYIGVLLAYFLVVTNFLYSQSIPTGIYMFLVVVVTTTTLIRLVTDPSHMDARASLRLGGTMLLQAIPLMLVLFVLFPRIPGPLWGLPEDSINAVTGLSDTMSPGDISRLSQSGAVAFRVRFNGTPPPAQRLYWRGPVMWDTDGRRWQVGEPLRVPSPQLSRGDDVARYTVTLEPHNQHWLLLLDLPMELPPGSELGADLVATREERVSSRIRYPAASALDSRVESAHTSALERALDLPADSHPRARVLARQWAHTAATPEAIIGQALDHFTAGDFAYTLQPPALPGDPVDEFLFDTRRGFCEHYATAFTVLMRAAGLPARVVTGYQGGEPNPVDDYWIVRQRDAHAWAEVWLEERGWVRVDPTAAVAPSRVELGMDGALPPPRPAIIGLGEANVEQIYELMRRLRFGWDAVNNWWNQWVLGYGQARQLSFLKRLGIDARDWRQLGISLLIMVSLALGGVALWLIHRGRGRHDRARRLYDRLCRKLARRGVECRPTEGPIHLGQRAAVRLPAVRAELEGIIDEYVRLRYGHGGSLPELARRVRRFRPPPAG
ncbi:MAG: DUF3488 and transglutaminase-like domain-containing protein [Gammaproteobacteria bacterium]|nr:DUF3488 and transglutaminase-like domain-containing protein [Gammaproteobacteria bacterium]